jgi:hypothetical protein
MALEDVVSIGRIPRSANPISGIKAYWKVQGRGEKGVRGRVMGKVGQ